MDARKPEVRPIVEHVLAIVEDLPQVVIAYAAGSFMAKAPSTFASLWPQARDAQVSFIVDEEVVASAGRFGFADRVSHRMHVDALDALDPLLVRWLQRAHAPCTVRIHKARPTAG